MTPEQQTPASVVERLKANAAMLSKWRADRADARTWGGPTIYPPHPITEDNAAPIITSLTEAAALIERLSAEREGLAAENRDLRSIPWPRAYVLERASEWKRLLREVGGYVKTCRGSCGSDMSGRDHAIAAAAEAVAMLDAALTQGESRQTEACDVAYALVKRIGRLPHPADEDFSYPDEDDAERDVLNGLIADAREIMASAPARPTGWIWTVGGSGPWEFSHGPDRPVFSPPSDIRNLTALHALPAAPTPADGNGG